MTGADYWCPSFDFMYPCGYVFSQIGMYTMHLLPVLLLIFPTPQVYSTA